ncbi:MAG TPA: hypothetical protein ENJ06_00395 [Phycisphaeraceae bacterium]|nr:hypothetical protein [Phycisphaeraceae bacterium]
MNIALLSLVAICGTAAGETIVVDTSSVSIDFGGSQMVSDLPGPDGVVSINEAAIASDNTPGVQTVAFNVPQSEWEYQWLYPGRVVLRPGTVRFFQPVILDATTQTDFTGDTNPDGAEVVIWSGALNIIGDDSTVKGFDNTAINTSASNEVIEENTNSSFSIFGGSGSIIRNNTGYTIKIDRSDNNLIVGNTVQRVRIWGFGSSWLATNNIVGGPNPEDRNHITGYGTWSEEGYPSGTTIQLYKTSGTIIENNTIGTTPDGLQQGNLASNVGIGFEGENFDVLIKNNLIAGILGHGQGPHHQGQLFGWAVLIGGGGSGIDIIGNTIGLDANNQPTLGSVFGIDVGGSVFSSVTDVTIGGTQPGEGNVIAGHLINGITVGDDISGVTIAGNSIYGNTELGIDLLEPNSVYGTTFNDPLDSDIGGNGLQNFPNLVSAVREGSSLHITGELHSNPLNNYNIEFFASSSCDASGYGEGQAFQGSTMVTTDAAGDAAFDVVIAGSVPEGWMLSATATREADGSTSEFSACIPVTGDSILGDLDGDGDVDQADLGILLAAYGQNADGDIDGDGDTDQADLGILLANYTG